MITMDERTLPHNMEAERAVLGAAMVAADAWPTVVAQLVAKDFYRLGHQLIFSAMATLAERGVAFDTLTVKEALGAGLEEIGGPAYIAGLADGVPRSTNVTFYAEIVREKARLRRVVNLATDLRSAGYNAELTAAQLAQQGVDALTKIAEPPGGGLLLAADALHDYIGAISDVTRPPALSTGFVDLDAVTGGFQPGDLVIIAARPSVGKTAFALGVADTMASAGVATAFFSLEMAERQLAARLLAMRSGVQSRALETHQATELDYQRVGEVLGRPPTPLYLQYTAKTVLEVTAWCQRVRDQAGSLSCVVVDYLQLLTPERRRESEESEIAGISRGLKQLAKDQQVVVVALSQLSRAPEKRRDPRPTMADLRGSGALEQDADIGLLLFREEMHAPKPENRGIAEAIVAKNRNGPVGVVRLVFLAELASFRNLAREFKL